MMENYKLILTCEHATNAIPQAYQSAFSEHQALLATHRGIDIGAAGIAQYLHQGLNCPYWHAQVSRLLIDCNRSLNNPHCFSKISNLFPDSVKEQIKTLYYQSYRQPIIAYIEKTLTEGNAVLHLSVHSFTPVLNGEERKADIGLLYNPARGAEKQFAQAFKSELKKYKVRMNYPYRGTSDGFTTALRKQFPENAYLGIELECNQSLVANPFILDQLKKDLLETLKIVTAV